MKFTEALDLLLRSTPDSIIAQLHQLHKSIQSADRAEILAIWHTLQTVRAGFHDLEIATSLEIGCKVSQIDAISKSVLSRMAILIEKEKRDDQQKLYSFFGGVTDYHPELASMCAALSVM